MVDDEPLGVLARDVKTSEKKKRVSLKTEAEHREKKKWDKKGPFEIEKNFGDYIGKEIMQFP